MAFRIMTNTDSRWDEFTDRLAGPEGCNISGETVDDFTWKCNHDHRYATAILADMGFESSEIEDSVEYFEQHGGFCDCEILWNVDNEL